MSLKQSDNITDSDSVNATFVRMQRRLKDIRRELDKTISQDTVCIYKVPQSLRGIRSSLDIEPEIVSIGPYHRGKNEVLEFERYKWRFLDSLLLRAKPKGVDVCKVIQAMEELESRARSCYSDPISMSSDDFVEMMVLDGCFIIELYLQVCKSEFSGRAIIPIFRNLWMIPILKRDLLKLENQLPFFVLQTLFDLCIGNVDGDPLTLLALKFFNLGSLRRLEANLGGCLPKNLGGWHLLHLLHSSYLPSSYSPLATDRTSQKSHPQTDQSMPCVTRLRAAGIKFRPRRTSDRFLEIDFHKGVLEILPITINDFTSTVFFNCAALEQCHPHIPTCFSAYIAFMSCLINSVRDVTFLCDDGIITNFSDTDSHVALFFKKLGENVVFNIRECHLSWQFRDVEAYYASNWATLRRTYFSSPWSFIHVVSTTVMLILTGIQTVITFLSYTRAYHS